MPDIYILNMEEVVKNVLCLFPFLSVVKLCIDFSIDIIMDEKSKEV